MRCVDADHLIGLVKDATILGDGFKQAFIAIVRGEPTIEPERKWETCFDCPLSNGCPKIRGCTNEQAEGYGSDIPDDCPLSIEPEREKGEWIYGEHDVAMCDGYWCNKCGFFVPWDYKHKSIDFIRDYHFCPNCGRTMMKKEKTNEESYD